MAILPLNFVEMNFKTHYKINNSQSVQQKIMPLVSVNYAFGKCQLCLFGTSKKISFKENE
jgi:hypothetical protein